MDNGPYGFSNLGYIIEDVPQEILSLLHAEKDKILSKQHEPQSYNINLAGNIQEEYDLRNLIPQLNDYVCWLSNHYKKFFDYNVNEIHDSLNIELADLWINFQKKHEFNPVHNHGGLFSFVVWLEIPYEQESEKLAGPGLNSNNNLAGCFEFQYLNIFGDIKTTNIPADSTYQGKICFFPAKMMHCVYPFYSSDDYRITVSGNVKFKF